jgi:hypothetical protein
MFCLPLGAGETDTFARLLGVIGAVTGSLGAGLALFSFLRDRPKLRVASGQGTERYGDGYALGRVEVTIGNEGRQPVTISDVGLLSADSARLSFSPHDLITLAPGEVVRVRASAGYIHGVMPHISGRSFTPYADDWRSRSTYGESAEFLFDLEQMAADEHRADLELVPEIIREGARAPRSER